MDEMKHDPVNHPQHYCQYEKEVIEVTQHLDFCLGSAVKYVLRAPVKGDEVEDLRKARWYVERAKGLMKREWPAALDYGVVASFKSPIVEAIVKQDHDKAIKLIDEKLEGIKVQETLTELQALKEEVQALREQYKDERPIVREYDVLRDLLGEMRLI